MNRLVTLGVKGGPSLRPGGAMPTSSLLELDGLRIVIDAGLGVSRALVQAGMPLKSLSVIFITHLHSDHILELGGLVHTAWTSGLTTPVQIFGPEGIEEYWAWFMQSMAYDIHLRQVDDGRPPLDALVSVTTITEGEVPFKGLNVTALLVPHPPVDQAFAFRFDGSRSVVFSGDTVFHPPLADFARDCDVLVHEALLPEGVEMIVQRTGGNEKLRQHLLGSHTSVEDVGRIATAARARLLVLNHLVPDDLPEFTVAHWQSRAGRHYSGPITVGRDGLEIGL